MCIGCQIQSRLIVLINKSHQKGDTVEEVELVVVVTMLQEETSVGDATTTSFEEIEETALVILSCHQMLLLLRILHSCLPATSEEMRWRPRDSLTFGEEA